MVLVPGARLGPYAIVDLIGAGGMGEVYRAHDTRLERTVALKILPPELSADPDRRARFTREAKAISQLSHPYICALYDIGDADLPSTEYRVPNPKSPVPSPVSVSYLVMEHLEGETLAARLDRGALPLDQALRVGAEMADALAYAHRHGIVHRDLKPGNIMLTASGVKLLDFGLAKLKAGSGLWALGSGDHARPTATTESLTTEGKVLGTVPYMAPEQVEGKETDARTDIFALGCVLYEMVTARRAFDGPSSAAILSAILRDDPPPVVDHQRLTPPQLDHLVRTCLAKDPGERWRSASDVARELQWIGAPTAAVRPQRLSRRSAMVAGVTALVLLAAGVLLGRWPRRGPPATTSASVAVVYFENLSDSRDQDSLGRMLTSLLITELSRSPRLEVVSSQRLFDIARRLGREDVPVDRSVATEIATRAGAASMLVGQVARTREGLVATTELVDVKSGQLLGSYRATGRTENDMFSMAETLGQEVRRGLDAGEAPAATSSGLARTQTQSVEAYRAYVRGEARMMQSDYDGAASEFRHAVRFDPDFALAYYFLGEAADIGGRPREGHEATLRALALEDRLPPSYGDVARARSLPWASRDRVPLLERALELDPSNDEALLWLSEVYAHAGTRVDPQRAAGFRERLFLTGYYNFALLDEQATTFALLGTPDRAEEIVAESEARWPALVPYTRAWLSAFAGRVDAALRHLEHVTAPAPVTSVCVLSEVPEIAGRWDLAERAVSQDPGETRWRARNLRLRGQFLVHRGAFDRAVQAYRQAVEGARPGQPGWFTDGVWASVYAALAELEALRGDLPAARRAMADALVLQPECPRWLYFAGRLAARARDGGASQQYLDKLRHETPTTRYVTRDLYRDALEAEMLLASGRPDAALPLAERVATSRRRVLDYWLDAEFASPVFHDTLVRTYLALGRKPDAVRALERLVDSGFERVHHPAIFVPALYTLGTLKIELGDKEDGERLLRRFLDHWGKASWDLKEVADARQRSIQ